MEIKEIYICEICKYSTRKYWSYDRHLKFQKHIKNVKNVKNKNILIDQIKTNDGNNLNEVVYKQIIEEKNKILEEKDKRLEEKDDLYQRLLLEKDKQIQEDSKRQKEDSKRQKKDHRRIQLLEKQLESYHNMINREKNSMSIVQYVTKNYNNAPHLTIFQNFDKEKKELIEKEMKKKELDENVVVNEYAYAEQVVNYYNTNKLITIVGKYIIDEYKKADPAMQAMWSSDTSRLTYLIKELLKDDTSDWIVDKNGVKICKYIIDPLLKFMRDDLLEYATKPCTNMLDMTSSEMELQAKYMQNSHKIINLIDNGTLKNSILKEIAPMFYMSHKNVKTIDQSSKIKTINNSKVKAIEQNPEVKTLDNPEVKTLDIPEVKTPDKLTETDLIANPKIDITSIVKVIPAIKNSSLKAPLQLTK